MSHGTIIPPSPTTASGFFRSPGEAVGPLAHLSACPSGKERRCDSDVSRLYQTSTAPMSTAWRRAGASRFPARWPGGHAEQRICNPGRAVLQGCPDRQGWSPALPRHGPRQRSIRGEIGGTFSHRARTILVGFPAEQPNHHDRQEPATAVEARPARSLATHSGGC